MSAAADFRPVRTARAFEEIAGQIRGELALGRLRPGDRLPSERALSEQFGVSRNTLREALRALENAGLLKLKKGAAGGAFVAEETGGAVIAGLRDMYHLGAIAPDHLTEARVWIESMAVRAACERATPVDLAAMHTNIAAAREAGQDFFKRAEIHLEFHRLIARTTRNPIMAIMMEAITEIMQHFIRAIGPHENRYVLPSRLRFMRHMEARDADAAVAEMESHLRRLHRYYLSRTVSKGTGR